MGGAPTPLTAARQVRLGKILGEMLEKAPQLVKGWSEGGYEGGQRYSEAGAEGESSEEGPVMAWMGGWRGRGERGLSGGHRCSPGARGGNSQVLGVVDSQGEAQGGKGDK